jgi:hypothetical protein
MSDYLLSEIKKTRERIEEITGDSGCFIRIPESAAEYINIVFSYVYKQRVDAANDYTILHLHCGILTINSLKFSSEDYHFSNKSEYPDKTSELLPVLMYLAVLIKGTEYDYTKR